MATTTIITECTAGTAKLYLVAVTGASGTAAVGGYTPTQVYGRTHSIAVTEALTGTWLIHDGSDTVGYVNDLVDEAVTVTIGVPDVSEDVTAILEDTGTTIPATLATAQADLDLITGADGATLATTQGNYAPATSTALSTMQGNVTDILADTNELQTNQGNWVTATGFATHSAADVVTALGTGSTLTACATATGFSTHSAANVVTAMQAAAGDFKADVSGLATATALATVDSNVDSVLAIANKLDTGLEDDGASGYQWTTLAMANGTATVSGNVTVGSLTQAALAQFVTDDTGETSAAAGSQAKLSQGAGASLSGPSSLDIEILDIADDSPIQNARVRVYRTGYTETKLTDASGDTETFSVDSATWKIAISAAGYESYAVAALAVSGDTSKTYKLTAVSISAPTDPTLSTVFCYAKLNGVAISGATLKAYVIQKSSAADGVLLSNANASDTTDENGYAALELVRGVEFTDGDGKYLIEVIHGTRTIWSTETIIPDQGSVNIEDLT